MVTQKLEKMATNGNINHDETAASAELQNQIGRTWHDSFVWSCVRFSFSFSCPIR